MGNGRWCISSASIHTKAYIRSSIIDSLFIYLTIYLSIVHFYDGIIPRSCCRLYGLYLN